MIFAKVLTKDFDRETDLVIFGSILKVVQTISDKAKRDDGWWITSTELLKGWVNDCDFELYTDEAPKKIYQFKNLFGHWHELSEIDYRDAINKGLETRIFYQIQTGT